MDIKTPLDFVVKYPFISVDKYLLNNLRLIKNEKQSYVTKKYSDIFTDINDLDFYNTLQQFLGNGMNSYFKYLIRSLTTTSDSAIIDLVRLQNKDLKISVSLADLLNALIIQNFFKRVDESETLLQDFQTSQSRGLVVLRNMFTHFQSYRFSDYLKNKFNDNFKFSCLSLFDCLLLAKCKLSNEFALFYNHFFLLLLRDQAVYKLLFNSAVTDVSNFLIDLNFDTLLKSRVGKCAVTGFYFHKDQLISFYNIDKKEHALKIFSSTDYRINNFFKADEQNYIYKYFVSNVTSQKIPNTINSFVRLDLSENFGVSIKQVPEIKYIKSINTSIFADDPHLKSTNYLSKFKSNNNQLRCYTDNVLKVLDQVLEHNEDQKNTQMYGLELECYALENAPTTIIKDIEENYLKGLCICKSDGSIDQSRGLEIVTTKMSFEFIKNSNLFYNFYEKIKNLIGSYESSSCGLHIHIGRSTLTRLQILRIIRFINNSKNFNYLFQLAGRAFYSNTYCKPKYKDLDLIQLSNKFKNQKIIIDCEKYNAVNIAKKETVELRIFKGNKRFDVINRYVEFTDCLINYTKNTKISLNDFLSFVEFTEKNKNKYPFLHKWHNTTIIQNAKPFDKKLNTGYAFPKLLEKRNIEYKPIKFEILENLKLPKVRRSRNSF